MGGKKYFFNNNTSPANATGVDLADRLDKIDPEIPGCEVLKHAPLFAREAMELLNSRTSKMLNAADEASRDRKLDQKGFPKNQPIRDEMVSVMERLCDVKMFKKYKNRLYKVPDCL